MPHGDAIGGSVATFETVLGTTDIELWVFRALWLVLPFLSGPLYAAALDDTDRLFQVGVSILLWGFWAVLLVASMVPRTQTLTALRVIPSAALVASAWAAIDAGGDASAREATIAVAATAVATMLSFRSTITDAFVDGSSYGDERRFLLGTPGPLLLGPLAIVWFCIVGGAVAGPLLLLSQRWILGAVALVLGWTLTWFAVPILHRLSNRWLVFVPAGLVLHDKTALREPQLFRVEDIEAFGPAPADTHEQDLSLDALGLALRVVLKEESKIIRNVRGSKIDLTAITGFVVSPNRPGAVIDEARTRNYPIA